MAHSDDDENSLPGELIEQLKVSDQALPLITSRVDREVSRLAAEQFSQRRKPDLRRRLSLAAAAAVAAAWFVVQLSAPRVDEISPTYADLDGSGRIDIADVLRLARLASESGENAQAEIDAFAMRIVALEPGSNAT